MHTRQYKMRAFERTIFRISPGILFLLLSQVGMGVPSGSDSLHFEILLTNKMVKDAHLADAGFINSFSTTSSRGILLSTPHQFYVLGWGGMIRLGKRVPDEIRNFILTTDNQLLMIIHKDVCTFDSLNNLSRRIMLPDEGMELMPGKGVIYAYDRMINQPKYAVYLIAKGGKYAKLFEITTPINSVVEMKNSLLFASGNGLLSFNFKSKEFKSVFALSKGSEIISVTVNASENKIFFSTANAIYAIRDSDVFKITDKFGGIIRIFNNGLLVFNNEEKFLIRIDGIENLIAQPENQPQVTSNEPVIRRSEIDKTQTKPAPVPVKDTTISAVQENPAPVPKENPPQPANPPVQETTKQPAPETSATTPKETSFPSGIPRYERFITNAQGNLEKGKMYVLKKDFSQPVDFMNNFTDGSILKLTSADPGSPKSWKVIKPVDGASAVIDSKLYMYFEQAHVWLLKSAP